MTTNRELEEVLKLTDTGKAFIDDVESVKDYLPKCNSMEFPKTFDEFANDYGFTDDKEIYTNGSHLIPVFRVQQWLEHIKQPTSDDCVSRQAVLDKAWDVPYEGKYIQVVDVGDIQELPPVTPTHGTCKDCEYWDNENNNIVGYCRACKHAFCTGTWDIGIYRKTKSNFYCADYEKRGSEDGK